MDDDDHAQQRRQLHYAHSRYKVTTSLVCLAYSSVFASLPQIARERSLIQSDTCMCKCTQYLLSTPSPAAPIKWHERCTVNRSLSLSISPPLVYRSLPKCVLFHLLLSVESRYPYLIQLSERASACNYYYYCFTGNLGLAFPGLAEMVYSPILYIRHTIIWQPLRRIRIADGGWDRRAMGAINQFHAQNQLIHKRKKANTINRHSGAFKSHRNDTILINLANKFTSMAKQWTRDALLQH